MISHSSSEPSSKNTVIKLTKSNYTSSTPMLQVPIPGKHLNVLDESQILSPPSTTLTPSSTPSTTPTCSKSSINVSSFGQQVTVPGTNGSTSAIPSTNPVNAIGTVSIPNNQVLGFNNGMLNTAFYNDPNLIQALLSNLIQNNNSGYISGMYPPINYGYGGSPGQLGGSPYFVNCCNQNAMGVQFGHYIPMNQPFLGFIGGDPSEQLTLDKHVHGGTEYDSIHSDLKQTQVTTPERNIDGNIANLLNKKTELSGTLEHTIDDDFTKKRRKETSLDSVNSLVETVATETNSTVDESVVKNIKNENEYTENGKNEVNNLSKTRHENTNKSEGMKENNDKTFINNGSGNGNGISSSLLSAIHEEELYMSSDRKSSFDKILRIHKSLVGSLSWTPPTNKDDVVLKSVSVSPTSATLESESISSVNKNAEDCLNNEISNRTTQTGHNEEYNPFKQREYNSANVTCFSPRMLPDWQLNWLRDVTRSISNVPKSPMTGIHFDRTKPAWAVSYYECETRKYYFFFIPDLSEYTIEITLAAAIGCRQNVVARGAHKRKKPGVLTFNLYSGQFEKSVPDSSNTNLSSGNTSLLKGNNNSVNHGDLFESDILSFKKDIHDNNIESNSNSKAGILESINTSSANCNLNGLTNLANLAALGTVAAAMSGSTQALPISVSAPGSESFVGSSTSSTTNGQGLIGSNTFVGNIFDQNVNNNANICGSFPLPFSGISHLQNNTVAPQIFIPHIHSTLLHQNALQSQLLLSSNAHTATNTGCNTSVGNNLYIPQYNRHINCNPFVLENVNASGIGNINSGLNQQCIINNNSLLYNQPQGSISSPSPPLSSSVSIPPTSTPTTVSTSSTPESVMSSDVTPISASSCNNKQIENKKEGVDEKTLDAVFEEASKES